MKPRAAPTPRTVTMSIAVSHVTYRALHELRLARCRQGNKMPTLATLLREALDGYVAQAGVLGCSRLKGSR